MSADLLKRAAKVLRVYAEAATPGPWSHVDNADPAGQPLSKEGVPSTFMGCGSVITLGEGVEGGDIAAPNGDLYPRSGYSPGDDMAYIALMHPPVALALADWLEDEFDQTPDAADDWPSVVLARAILRDPR